MVLIAVEVSPVGSKPPAAVGERIFKGEIHDVGAATPFSTTTSSLQGRAKGLTLMPKLVEHIGSGREVSPVGSKPPAAVGERIFKGETHDVGAATPFSTTTSSLQGRAKGLTLMPKLVEHIGSGSTRLAESYPTHRLYCFSGALLVLASLCV